MVNPFLSLCSRHVSLFALFGCGGASLGVLGAIGIGEALELDRRAVTLAAASALAAFVGINILKRVVLGDDQLVFFRSAALALSAVAATAWLLDHAVLRYLDVGALAVFICGSWGRIGCLTASCCHGKPCSLGIRYGPRHVELGLDPHLVGVRLFPVQAAEATWMLAVVVSGSILLLSGHRAGETLAYSLVAYSFGRFHLEFLRGDVRPFAGGFSEAQWTALLTMTAVALAGWKGELDLRGFYVAATAAAGASLITIGALRTWTYGTPTKFPGHPAHVQEFIEASRHVMCVSRDGTAEANRQPAARTVHIAATSLGIKVSASRERDCCGAKVHVALSVPRAAGSGWQYRWMGALLEDVAAPLRIIRKIRDRDAAVHFAFEEGEFQRDVQDR